ncbi:hypothetical protein BDV96DRAFT_636922 [Lophiotrema nucula]|uniref:Azaphilone pigments biosynthesis cluster protein L N-terminal domain-containing protein n=1 Tax=Lophiotrema nucula TaxID=690887 RepID=A0A6A5YQA5_9PLEO|nr:hypothetical protein BDV96DRAFT_636922 [Lophiotrema nucula]
MAEPISLVSGLVALSAFAFKSSVTLYNTIQSFRNYPKDVRDLNNELQALNEVLSSLTETADATTDVDLSALHLPLLRCGNACKEFEQKLLKCSSRSGSNGMSFRGWAQLKYLGDSIDSFRHMLGGYKSTIILALTGATLRRSTLTVASLDKYRNMAKTTTIDLEARLEVIDGKLESIFEQHATESDSENAELRAIKDDRLSTTKCLEICAQLLDHINRIPLRPVSRGRSPTGPMNSERITTEGLMECKETLSSTTARLERHMEGLIDQFGRTMTSEEGAAELATLREEWGAARHCIDICSTAGKNITVIDNYTTGDNAVQFLVSTKEKTVHGRNRGYGSGTMQIGGHLSDESVQQISRDNSRHGLPNIRDPGLPSRDNSPPVPDDAVAGSNEEFRKRYGRGLKLASKSVPDIIISSRGPADC